MFVCSSPAGKNSEKEGRFGDKQGGDNPKNDNMQNLVSNGFKLYVSSEEICEFLFVLYKYRRCCDLYGSVFL